MSLPDERPRQSVANLIGRFEQQGKRQVMPATRVPRSSSVSSQIAGDGAKEEAKEKREWPPKPPASADAKPTASTLASSPPSMSKSPVSSPQPISDPTPPVNAPTTPVPTSPEPPKPPPSKGKAAAAIKSTPTAATRRSVASPQKFRSPAVNTAKSAAGSPPPKTSIHSSVSQPLKPQHTGQSVVSNLSTTRQARGTPRTTPSTPARPKSSVGHHQSTVRPKTPSSGLFAPTAASLARSRNAPPVPSPPIKKVTLSSDAAERLSKPTAASLSRARAPAVPVTSPARVAKPTSAGGHGSTPRGSSKPKVGCTPANPKEAITNEKSKPDLASASSEPFCNSDHGAADHLGNGHTPEAAALSGSGLSEDARGHSEVLSDATHDPMAEREVHSDSGVHHEQHRDEHPVGEALSHEHAAQNFPEEAAHEQEEVLEESRTLKPADSVVEAGDDERYLQSEPRAPGNDIEDIVNLLEGTKPRPQSIVSIPDEHEY